MLKNMIKKLPKVFLGVFVSAFFIGLLMFNAGITPTILIKLIKDISFTLFILFAIMFIIIMVLLISVTPMLVVRWIIHRDFDLESSSISIILCPPIVWGIIYLILSYFHYWPFN